MKILESELKRIEDQHTIAEGRDYIVANANCIAIAWFVGNHWYPSNMRTVGGTACIVLDFEPTHFAEIKLGASR